MNKLIRFLIKGFIVICVLLALIAAASFTYVYFNKDKIVNGILNAIGTEMNGVVMVEGTEFSFIKYFPSTSINLKGLTIRDSLYNKHQTDALQAENAFVRINIKDLFSSKIVIDKLLLENGRLNIFTDSLGYTNRYLFNSGKSENNFTTTLKKIELRNMQLVFKDQTRFKYFNVVAEELKVNIQRDSSIQIFSLQGKGILKMLGFNTRKGLFAVNTSFDQFTELRYDSQYRLLIVLENTLYLNGNAYENKGIFNFNLATFNIEFSSPRAMFSDVVKLLPNRTQQRLSMFNFKKTMQLQVAVSGSLNYGVIPEISANFETEMNAVMYEKTPLEAVAMNATFHNKWNPEFGCSDSNSVIQIKNFKASWQGIPFTSELVQIIDLIHPVVTANIKSEFPLKSVSKLSGSDLYNFSAGNGNLDFKLVANPDKTGLHAKVTGGISIINGSVMYGPRSMPFNSINASIRFDGSGIVVDKLSCISGKSKLSLKGSAPAIFSLADSLPDKAELIWTVKSDFIDLADFTGFLTERKKMTSRNASSSQLAKAGQKADRLLSACKLSMSMDVKELHYKTFAATSLKGGVKMIDNIWFINNVSFKHADGAVALTGTLKEISAVRNDVAINAALENVNINKIFVAFDNFSQSAVTDKNIRGVLNADVQLNFQMNNKAVISQRSLSGTTQLSITDGELKGFQPLGKLSRLIFRKRDFTEIKFSELTNEFTVKGNQIHFDRMKINSSVMEMYVEGDYFLDGKADMDIQVPLSNLQNRDWEEISENVTDEGEKGMNVYIKAETDEKGELQFKYNPLKKIRDKREETIRKFRDRIKVKKR
ncbi:MAG: hypothetical protein IPN54_04890 [Bacteroidetes bacterium]|nr:hypothetical protein [Bacteroidota bacterium]